MNTQTQPTQSDVSYEDILNKDILDLMGAKDMAEDKKQDLYTKMFQTIQNRVIARISDALSDEDVAEWQKISESQDNQQIENFLKTRGIDLAQLMLQEALSYKSEMIALAKPIRNVAQNNN